ncbi:polysaccharide deacetylase family protein [Paenibacillus sp. SYP-B3998]|uniref:Polysaccharide deacetylase family protein n=2 Tax=Paenibacillus sp. SYP-B3998 TaxID=2678564 RepID=A0A6G3ZV27_9BACL|nr:polysaccharide deacetylase family protein [Paenibacillus sp. SYP-B3998]
MRAIWKPALLILIIFVNFFPFSIRENEVFYSKEVSVLVYHHIDDHQQGGVTITTKVFEDQLAALDRRGYNFITLDQFRQFLLNKRDVPDNAVLITFDDGYRSFYTNAYPILKKMEVPAVNFVITKDLEDPLRSLLLPSLSREEIVKMRTEDPNIEFQSHSDSLHAMQDGKPMLTNKLVKDKLVETEEQFKQRIVTDTRTCIRKLKELNASEAVDAYAYPFGSFDSQTIELLKQNGVQLGFTTKTGLTTSHTDPMQVPRINTGVPYVQGNTVHSLIKQSLRHQLQPIS